MFKKRKASAAIAEEAKKIKDILPECTEVNNGIPVKEYMIKWLSAFAPDMTYVSAKAYCLPRLMYKNYLWHAFSFNATVCLAGDEVPEVSFKGKCFILMCETNTLYVTDRGDALTPDIVAMLGNAAVFDAGFTKTYVHTGKDNVGPFYKEA